MRYAFLLAVASFCFTWAGSAAADPLPESVSIVTWNLEWFFDDYTGDNPAKVAREQSAPSKDDWEWKLSVTAEAIAKLKPTILCLQEVESRRAMYQLTKRLKEQHSLDYRIAFIEGNDVFTEQDVCVLAQSGLVEFSRREQTKEMWQSKEYYDLQKHIFARFEWGEGDKKLELLLLNVHMRAMPEQNEIRARQARLIHKWLAPEVLAGKNVVFLGDTNTEYAVDQAKPENDQGILRGMTTETKDDDLFDLLATAPSDKQATHIIHKPFDRIFVSENMRSSSSTKPHFVFKKIEVRADVNTRGKEQDKDHWNIYYKIDAAERDVSDHFPVMAEFDVK